MDIESDWIIKPSSIHCDKELIERMSQNDYDYEVEILVAAKNWSENLNFRTGMVNNDRLYADAPAANQLYGGRMNQIRRNAIGAITQVNNYFTLLNKNRKTDGEELI